MTYPILGQPNTGDTAWMLASSALVLLMTPGLAFFYGGMVRSKNVLGMLMQNFMMVGIILAVFLLLLGLPLMTGVGVPAAHASKHNAAPIFTAKPSLFRTNTRITSVLQKLPCVPANLSAR